MPKNCCVREPHNILKPTFGVPKDEFKKNIMGSIFRYTIEKK